MGGGGDSRVLIEIFGLKRDVVTGNGENYITRSFIINSPHPILLG
jgi:hypothetical protein